MPPTPSPPPHPGFPGFPGEDFPPPEEEPPPSPPPPSPSPPPTPRPRPYKRLGCFRDKRGHRAFPNMARKSKLTTKKCAAFAADPPATYKGQTKPQKKPTKLFATQYGKSVCCLRPSLVSCFRPSLVSKAACSVHCVVLSGGQLLGWLARGGTGGSWWAGARQG